MQALALRNTLVLELSSYLILLSSYNNLIKSFYQLYIKLTMSVFTFPGAGAE